MDNYSLQSNEVVLYKNECSIKDEKAKAELVLTNLKLILITKTKKLFEKEQIQTEIHPIDEIKIYNDIPQIKQNDTCVEIFFIGEEKTVDLFSKSEVRKFLNKAFELLTGKTTAARVLNKVKDANDLVDDTIGVNVVGVVKNVTEKGLVRTIFGGFGKK